ncbi:MAG: ATP-binding protein, partial [Dehalococcoidia bacterium]|nr:ATP-binding protein [Dehalococcoidia bacterium]
MGRIASGVAHDFNNLLTVILAETDMALAELAPDHPLRAGLDEIRQTTQRAASLTRQLLAFSRRQVVEPEFFSLNDLVADVEKMLRRLIGEDIELSALAAPDLGPVKADRGHIEQVLVNLAVNARDAMPDGGRLVVETANVTLTEEYTATHSYAAPGEYVVLAVSDSGTGMTEEVKAHLFEPFFTTKEQGRGTGLGLATCYGIAKQHGGFISVYSELGIGTTFKVYLPRAGGVAAGPAPVGEAARGGTETVLLVEDDPKVRNVTARMLHTLGYTVLEAGSAEQALTRLQAHRGPVHLLITDAVLPAVGGRQLAGQVQAARPGTRVLYMSGYTDDVALKHRLLERGVHFLQKPFAP